MTMFDHGIDRHGQVIYLCPDCGDVFLAVLPSSRPTDDELITAFCFHRDGQHSPATLPAPLYAPPGARPQPIAIAMGCALVFWFGCAIVLWWYVW